MKSRDGVARKRAAKREVLPKIGERQRRRIAVLEKALQRIFTRVDLGKDEVDPALPSDVRGIAFTALNGGTCRSRAREIS